MTKKIIINADDFGMSRESNEGIKEAILAGSVTSVSVMVNMPFFADAVNFLKKHREVGVGLHFNVTEGKERNFNFLDLKKELSRQYAVLKKTGLSISHIDSHQHVHAFPFFFKLVYDFAAENNVARVRGCAFSVDQFKVSGKILLTLKQLLLWKLFNLNYFLFVPKKRNSQHPFVTRFLFDLNWHNRYTQPQMSQLVENLPAQNIEIICHLSSSITSDPLSRGRFECLSFIKSPAFARSLRKRHAT